MNINNITWQWYDFSQLSNKLLYDLLKLRQDIFIVEQESPCDEIDNLDMQAKHLIYMADDLIIGYLRLLPIDLVYKGYQSFGRVVIRDSYRGKKISHLIMENLLQYIQENHLNHPIKISAQYYLLGFYKKYGFAPIGEIFLENDIEHIYMIRQNK